jgi:hypothetical protein
VGFQALPWDASLFAYPWMRNKPWTAGHQPVAATHAEHPAYGTTSLLDRSLSLPV